MNLEIRYIPIDAIAPYKNNSRTHSEEQVEQICKSISEFGFTNPILLDENNTIIAGHGRIEAAKKLGHYEVPTILLTGLTEDQKKAYVIADNKLALNADWDYSLLKLEVEMLQESGFEIGLLGFSEVELETIFNEEIDLSILDELDDEDVDAFEENVKKAIQIEFEAEHYEEASELISFWRKQGAYVGGLILDFLRLEKEKL